MTDESSNSRGARASAWDRTGGALWRLLYGKLVQPLLRINDSPHSLALGITMGVFIAFTPTVGVQITIVVQIARDDVHGVRARDVVHGGREERARVALGVADRTKQDRQSGGQGKATPFRRGTFFAGCRFAGHTATKRARARASRTRGTRRAIYAAVLFPRQVVGDVSQVFGHDRSLIRGNPIGQRIVQ